MSAQPARFPHRTALSLALALAVLPAHADEVTVEDLARRLQALEQRLGVAPETGADGVALADLDQRLRVLERRLALQADEAAANAAGQPVVALGPRACRSNRRPATTSR